MAITDEELNNIKKKKNQSTELTAIFIDVMVPLIDKKP